MKGKALQALSSEYVRRISAFTRVEIIEVKDESNAHAEREAEASRIKDSEAEQVFYRRDFGVDGDNFHSPVAAPSLAL